jgi:DNA primase
LKFSREFLDELKTNTNLKELAEEYTELKQAGPTLYVGHCPHPKHNDSDASFCVNTQTNTWTCYGCHSDKKNKEHGNYGSDAIAFIEWVNEGKISWIDTVKFLAKRINLPIPNDSNSKIYKQNYNLTQKYIKDMTCDAYEYLYDRGLDDETIEKWTICYDKYDDRVVFPLFDSYNNIVGFNKRLVTPQTKGLNRKYIHSPDSDVFKKSQYFYGMQFLDRTKDYIVLTEGVFDVILPQMYGVSNVICGLGTTLSEYQINVLAKLGKTVIVVYDNDEKGSKTMKKVMPLLESNGISAKLLVLPEGKDLAEITLELKYDILEYILDNSVTYGYYQIQNSINAFNRDLYDLYHKYNNIFDTVKDSVPESEKSSIQLFIDNCFRKGAPIINAM